MTRISRAVGWASVWFVAASAPCFAQPKAQAIWGDAIMPQPFERQAFHEVRVPEWVQGTIGCGYALSVMASDQRAEAVKHGVSLSEVGFVDPFYAYYDSKLLERRNPGVPLERTQRDIADYKRLGVRILGVYPPCLQGEVYEKHPDWRRIATNTTEIPSIDLKQFPHGGMLCLLGPYGDFFIDVLAEIVTQFPEVDAFSFDGLHYGGVCYCPHCRENYRKETEREIPNLDMNDPAFRRYQHWADRRMEDVIQRMQTRLKGIKPDLALVTWTTNAGRFGHFLSIPRNMPARMNLLLDAPDQEFWLDETNRGTTVAPAFANAYIWATTNHRVAFSEPYLMSHGNPYGKDSFPPHEVLCRMLLALTYGAAPSIAVIQPAPLQKEIYHCLDEVQRRKPWLTHKRPEPWGALLMSDNTRNFYGRSAGQVEERYMANVLGTFRAAVEEHLPLTVINDWNLNEADLARYKLLVLSNSACLDERQLAAIEEFVKAGGGLVASLDASLFDEFGDPRKNFALADLFGVDYRGVFDAGAADKRLDVNFEQALSADYWEKRKNVFDFETAPASWLRQGRLAAYVGDQPVTLKSAAIRVEPRKGSDAEVLGWLRLKSGDPNVRTPGVVARKHGQGRVVYLAAGFDAAYYLYAYPYQRLVLRQAIDWVAPSAPPIKVEAPMCVHTTLMRQEKEGKRLIVHLFNDVNTTAFHALATDDVPLREEVLPIHDIRIIFAPGHRFSKFRLRPDGLELAAETTPEGTRVIVPRLERHAMVVGELEE